jgi:hypothetical protein
MWAICLKKVLIQLCVVWVIGKPIENRGTEITCEKLFSSTTLAACLIGDIE